MKIGRQLRTELLLMIVTGYKDRIDGRPAYDFVSEPDLTSWERNCAKRREFAYTEAYRLGLEMDVLIAGGMSPEQAFISASRQDGRDGAATVALSVE